MPLLLGFFADSSVYLAGREYWYVFQGLALSRTGKWLDVGVASQIGFMVFIDDYFFCTSDSGPQAKKS